MTTLIISNEEMDNITKIKSLNGAGVLIMGISETLENEAKKKKSWITRHAGRYIRGLFMGNFRSYLQVK